MKLSIITINYNNEKGLFKTLESVLRQNYIDYEQIIIDGKSTDNSVNTIKQFEKSSSKPFKWISEKDNGIYHAQNKGIGLAEGQYCLFLNSGDYFVDENVLKNIFTKEDNEDLVFGNIIILDGKKEVILKGKENVTFLDIYLNVIKHQAAFIKRSLLLQYGCYDESLKIVADWSFFIKSVGLHNHTIKYVDVDVSFFDIDGVSAKNEILCASERERVVNDLIPFTWQNDISLLSKYYNLYYIDKFKFWHSLVRIIGKISKKIYLKK
ncbi:glycosyltransferase [Paludibacter sp. 221]|uniref:glycosyltransferase family 2 protein n=1 Tax=Paludibacter sp. 221 TaxID=2302939 RepID=UPI0013D6B5B7|nr:glycosyltransferase family 2 protein [Paludibacter sp. 221]NDV46034.1 glycosyltransferase [Paludibacter sp. 221]